MAQRPSRTRGSVSSSGQNGYSNSYRNAQGYSRGNDFTNGYSYHGDQHTANYGVGDAYGVRQAYDERTTPRGTYAGNVQTNAGAQSVYGNQVRGARKAYPDRGSKRANKEAHGIGGLPLVIIVAILGAIVGALAAYLVMNMTIRVPQPVTATIAADKLSSTTVGTYRYEGKTYDITAYDAIAATKSLEAAKNEDGTYDTPSADMILSYARNEILKKLVHDNGIVVSDEQIQQYAYELTGSMNMDDVAAYFDMDVQQAWSIMGEAAAVKVLRETVVGTNRAPVEPNYPADGNTEVGTAEYANYIIALLGSNWDSTTGTWANTTNDFYRALQDKVFAPGSANYEAAQAAYSVAYEMYVENGSAMQAWSDYVNKYLDEGSITIATLRA